MILNIRRGETTLDVLKRRSGPRRPSSVLLPSAPVALSSTSTLSKEKEFFVWIPREVFTDTELARLPAEYQGSPVSLEPDDRDKTYDLGKDRNWKRWLALKKSGPPGIALAVEGSDEL